MPPAHPWCVLQHADKREEPRVEGQAPGWIYRTPVGVWARLHGHEVRLAAPWLAAAFLALLLAGAAGGLEAFGVALGLEGLGLGVWGSLLAVRASEGTRELRAGVVEVQDATARLTRAVDRINGLDDLRTARGVRDALLPLVTRATWGASGSDEPTTPLRLSDKELRDHGDRLRRALRAAEALDLPTCQELDHALVRATTWGVYEFREVNEHALARLVVRADEEVLAEILLAHSRLR